VIPRRRALTAALALAATAACDRDPSPATKPQSIGRWREIGFPADALYPEREHAAVLVEEHAPIVVALHGRGEASRGVEAGARGWRDDYALDHAQARVRQPPLTKADFHGFVQDARLDALNTSLNAAPFRGLNVACPHAPALSDRSVAGAGVYGRFLVDRLIPRVREIANAPAKREATSIDGVSMGGRLALQIGWTHPNVFGAVGALQAAIGVKEADALADLAGRAHATRPQRLRLVSSDADPFLPAIVALSEALARRNLVHELIVTPGPHDYVWNKGPGSYELLLWHERVLRGLPAP
jgi:iron(III)-salmochelin esterase